MMIAASDLLSVYQLLFNEENEHQIQAARMIDLNIAPKFKDLILDLRTAWTSSTSGELAIGSSTAHVCYPLRTGFVC